MGFTTFTSRWSFLKFALFILAAAFISNCTPGTELLNKVPVNSVDIKVLDQNGEPLQGASVEASNGRTTSTDGEGLAKLRFGSIGIHNVTVTAPNYMPSTMTVTMPSDNGEVKTARLAQQVDYSASASAGSRAGFAQMYGAQMYPMMFTYMFNSFGYNMELTDYEAGEWTKWRIATSDNEDDALILKKAFLMENEEGQQWWQLQMFQESDESATYTAEVLFDENRSSIRRYREKIGDNDAQEKPVTENWYSQPSELTEESIEGALAEENISVKVPNGTFTADLINYGVGPGVNLKIWRVLDVPGGTVQYSTEQEDETVYQSQLIDYGSDAETVLNSF